MGKAFKIYGENLDKFHVHLYWNSIMDKMRDDLRWFSMWGEGTKEEFAWCFDIEARLEMLEDLGF